MASFFCHEFGVTKQVRLERIVRRQLLLAEREDEALTAEVTLACAPSACGHETERARATVVAGEYSLTVAPTHIHEIAFASCALGRDDCQVAAAVHVASSRAGESLAGVHDVAADWQSHAARSHERSGAQRCHKK